MNKACHRFSVIGIYCLFLNATWTQAELKLPGLFGDHMVLQRDQAVPVWGTAAPGAKVIVKFRDQEKTATAGADGKWMVKLDPLKAGGPDKLSVIAENTVVIDDVLVGEVWVGSGQSNMAGWVREYTNNDPVLAGMWAGAPYPQIRQVGIQGPWQVKVNGRWRVADAGAVGDFSALLFAFGLRLHRELGVPVGLMIGAASGSSSGLWISEEALKADAACQESIKKFAATFDQAAELQKHAAALEKWKQDAAAAKAQNKPPPAQPNHPRILGEVYAGKVGDRLETYIRPLMPYGIRGVLWDQGENGTGVIGINDQYILMDALIRCWRREWAQGDFPFIYIQKTSGGGCAWDYSNPVTAKADPFAPLPETLNGGPTWGVYIKMMNIPNAGMAICSDLGTGQHPANKSGYGHRAADVALGMVYGRKIQYYGPIYDSHKVEGDKIRVSFKQVGQGLAFRHGDKLQGFAISEEGRRFFWADARIEGDTVVVSSTNVLHPSAVWYGWLANRPWANLFNKDGLPAVPFNTAIK